MPGIAAIFGAPSSSASDIGLMVDSMMHEPFYDSAMFSSDAQNARIGWTFFKNAAAERMPVWNEANDICLILCGETFDAQRSRDLSSWLQVYENEGFGALEGLNGWFSGLLIDRRGGRIAVFNDRYGINRIYVHESGDGTYLASEAKALLKVLPRSRTLDYQSLG